MKVFLLLITFIWFADTPKKCVAKKTPPVKKEIKAAAYQFPSILIISIN